MNPIAVEQFVFSFTAAVAAEPYETRGATVAGWPLNHRVVDFVCIDPGTGSGGAWLVEAKDYRVITNPPRPANLANLPETMESKARHTLLGLQAVAGIAGHALAFHAATASATPTKRVVLHLEPHPPNGPDTGLFPSRFEMLVHQKLKSLVYDIDPNPLVLDIAQTPAASVPWTVT